MLTNWEMAVAAAADHTPMWNTPTKIRSSTTLTREEIIRYCSGWRLSPTACKMPMQML